MVWVRMSRGALQTLYRAVLALWPPKAFQQAQQRWEPPLHWPLRASEVGFGLVYETACETEVADETAAEAGSEVGSAAEFVLDAGAVRQPAFWAFELSEAAVLMDLEGWWTVQSLLV